MNIQCCHYLCALPVTGESSPQVLDKFLVWMLTEIWLWSPEKTNFFLVLYMLRFGPALLPSPQRTAKLGDALRPGAVPLVCSALVRAS